MCILKSNKFNRNSTQEEAEKGRRELTTTTEIENKKQKLHAHCLVNKFICLDNVNAKCQQTVDMCQSRRWIAKAHHRCEKPVLSRP
jgi:hypothetical protein